MTTSTHTKKRDENRLEHSMLPTDDELLAKDLPRPKQSEDSTAAASSVADKPASDVRAQVGSDRIRPVELEPGPSTEHDSKPKTGHDVTEQTRPWKKRPATPTAGDATPPHAGVASPGAFAPGMDVENDRHPDPARNMPMVRQTGQTLRFPSGVNLIPGRTVNVNGVDFEIKPEEAFKGMFWAKSLGIMVVTLLAAIGVAYLLSGPDPGMLSGVVINAETGEIVPNASIALGDDRSATTNEAGIYFFEDVDPEQFVLTAAAPGFVAQNGYVEIEGNEFAQLSFALAPIASVTENETTDTLTSARSESSENTEAKEKTTASSTGPSYGSVDLNVDFTGYLVFVDGELYGKNSDELKRLTEGKHRVLLQLDGYEDYTANVTVKARNRASISVAKSDLKPRVDPIRRSRGHFAQGKASIDEQDWARAIREFNEALRYDAEYAEALQYRGWVYLKTDNPSLAMSDFTRAADLFDQSRRYIDAVACAKYMIEISPKDPAHWRRRADYNLALTDYKQAIEDYKEAVRLDKRSLESHLALAEALYAAGEYKDAAKEFDRARKLADDPSHAYIRMILSYYNAGEREDVVKKYEDFAEVAPPELLDRLRDDPEWLKVLQMVGPNERLKN